MSETLKTPTIQEIEDSKARGEQSAFNKGPNGELLDEGYTTNDLGKVVWVGEGPEPGGSHQTLHYAYVQGRPFR